MSAGGPHAVRHQEGARVDGRDIKVNGPARRSSLRPARCSGAAATGPRPWTTSPTPRGSAGPCCCITSRPRSAVLGDLLAGYTTAITAVANRLLDATPHDRAAAATEAGRCRGRPARPSRGQQLGHHRQRHPHDGPGARLLAAQGNRLRLLLAATIGGPDAELLATAAVGAVTRPFAHLPHAQLYDRRDQLAAAAARVMNFL